jgi:uncharacterized membrane protein
MFQFVLFLHILAVVFAFGPNAALAVIGAKAGTEPQHSNFALRLNEFVETRIVIPLALVVLVTGLLLVWLGGIGLLHGWLLLALLLYFAALGVATGVMLPNTRKMIRASEMMLARGPGAAGAGPPPEVARSVRILQIGGIYLLASIVVILFLMVERPGG